MVEETKDVNEPIIGESLEKIDYKDLYIRLLADHDNYVKRSNKTISDTTRNAQSNNMIDVVMPIYNDLCYAVEQNVEGAKLLLDKMRSAIEKSNYDIIDMSFIERNAVGYFTTEYCDAISTVPYFDNYDVDMVACVVKVGLYDKIKKQTVVHAQCVVAK